MVPPRSATARQVRTRLNTGEQGCYQTVTTYEVVRFLKGMVNKINSKKPCTTEGCDRTGNRYVNGRRVCDTCRSRHYRKGKKVCTLDGCHAFVKFGAGQPRRWCRRHEPMYLTERAEQTTATLDYLTRTTTIRNNGCWQYQQVWGPGAPRPTISSGGLKWQVIRFMYVWHFGGHDGHLELHHICSNRWCVHPGHVTPITGPRNRAIEHPLNEDEYFDAVLQANDIGSAPLWPDDPAKAVELDEFAARLKRQPWNGSALLDTATTIPTPEPEPVVKADKPEVDLFLTERPPRASRGRRRRVALAS